MAYSDLLKFAERQIGTQRAAGIYYGMMHRVATRLGLSCFNYGYAEIDEQHIPTDVGEEPFQLDLYRQTALAAGEDLLKDGVVLDVSCGLGGGLNHVSQTFSTRLAIGTDLVDAAVKAAQKRFRLLTVQSAATDLKLPDGAFDVVLSVEASHVYFGDTFLSEIARVLHSGGRFALTDNRLMSPEEARSWLEGALAPHGLTLVNFRDITANVLRSCELDNQRRENFLAKLPRPARSPLREMIGGTNTKVFANMRDGRTCYFIAAAEKA